MKADIFNEAKVALEKWDARWEDCAIQEAITRDPLDAIDIVRRRMERCVLVLRVLLAEQTCSCGKPRTIGPCSGSCDNDE